LLWLVRSSEPHEPDTRPARLARASVPRRLRVRDSPL